MWILDLKGLINLMTQLFTYVGGYMYLYLMEPKYGYSRAFIPLLVRHFRAFSKSQNWPTRPWLDQSF